MELLAAGRMAEVFAWGEGRVLKLDRPEWNGMAAMEAAALSIVAAAGLSAPQPYETVVVGDRHGIVLERIEGPILSDVIAAAVEVDELARHWCELHESLNAQMLEGLSDLVPTLADCVRGSGLASELVEELVALLDDLDDGRRGLCHYDLHAGNVIVGPAGWVVIDWMTASTGPPDADFARSLLLDPPSAQTPRGRFMAAVAREGMRSRGVDRIRLHAWVRVLAAARLAEGFEGERARFLAELAAGDRELEI